MSSDINAGVVDDPAAVVRLLEDWIAEHRPRIDLKLADSIRDDLNVDSLTLMEAMSRVEDSLEIQLIDNPRIQDVVTIADLVELIQLECRGKNA
ncbi:acyl carrier protein [Nocardia sp. NPDC058114]|uniref:acyl carrier protein n=1 Tax=Nocardia sp. NPDC058114 TaxID=3346346 RepID=UPI0036DDD2AE